MSPILQLQLQTSKQNQATNPDQRKGKSLPETHSVVEVSSVRLVDFR